ncbi:MAG: GAK system XXXCH domain-containing protein [Desulfovibrionales bacterium]|nr:GAK system XXXCH domain-containing protein [Desulfovibrionales bacterium]
MTDEQTAEFLRQLASGIEHGQLELNGNPFEWSEIQKIKISFKNQASQVMVKTRVKSNDLSDFELDFDGDELDQIESDQEDSGLKIENNDKKPSYKSLKKKMKRRLKTVHQAITSSQLPAEQEMMAFASECQLMTSYPGYGDEYYQAFMVTVEEMVDSYKRKDMAKLEGNFQELIKFMKDCHDRYK